MKSDLTSEWVCRLLRHMDATGTAIATPALDGDAPSPEPFIDFSSGYVERARDQLPKQGAAAPWRLHQNYARDLMTLRYGRLDDGVLRFTAPAKAKEPA